MAEIPGDEGLKRCGRGKQCLHPGGPWLPLSEFLNDRSTSDGKQWECKFCHRYRTRLYQRRIRKEYGRQDRLMEERLRLSKQYREQHGGDF